MYRRLGMEPLESRQLLSITLGSLSAQTVTDGAPLNVALNGSTGNTGDAITYSVAVSNSTLTNPLTTSLPTGNPSLKITVSDPVDGISGDMVFQLFQSYRAGCGQ